MRKKIQEYVARIKTQQVTRPFVPDFKTCSEFAELCIENLDSVSGADVAGFYDEAGRAWTISKRRSMSGIEIFIKCKERNVFKYGRVFQTPIKLAEEDEDEDENEKQEQNEVPIYIGKWVVLVTL